MGMTANFGKFRLYSRSKVHRRSNDKTMTEKSDTPSTIYSAKEIPSLKTDIEDVPQKKFEDLPAAAQRALKEAEERRQEIDAKQVKLPAEVNGRGGLEPTRYDDWEIKGLTSDF